MGDPRPGRLPLAVAANPTLQELWDRFRIGEAEPIASSRARALSAVVRRCIKGVGGRSLSVKLPPPTLEINQNDDEIKHRPDHASEGESQE
jgi:hypothetical protein